MPSAIMKWRPAPGIIRLPIPSTIAVNPMTAITIRTPTVIDRNHRRLPAVADVFDFNPVAIGPQRLRKKSGGPPGGGAVSTRTGCDGDGMTLLVTMGAAAGIGTVAPPSAGLCWSNVVITVSERPRSDK